MDYTILSLLPIAVCFALIVIVKNPFIAIGGGIVTAIITVWGKSGEFVLFNSITDVVTSQSTVKTTLFVLLIGALVFAMNKSGGINGMISYLESKKLNIHSKVGVQLFTMLIGVLMFVDGTSSMALTAVVGKPLFQRAGIKTEKLALVTNSTAAPIAWLIPFGGAGAMVAGLLSQIDGVKEDAFSYVIKAVPFQLYTIVLLLLLVITILCNFEFGPIRKIKFKEEQIAKTEKLGKARNMVIPIVVLLFSIALILVVTGNGNIMNGDSSSAVFYGGIATLVITLLLYTISKTATIKECLSFYFDGIKSMFFITILLVLAFIFSNLLSRVGTATYLIGMFDVVPISMLPLIALLLCAVIAFFTGTSGGTVAIVTSIMIPMAVLQGGNISLVLGAIISGSVFGDQNSVISDSVIMTSSVTGVDAVTHVKTQLPYTLVSLGISALLFLLLGNII